MKKPQIFLTLFLALIFVGQKVIAQKSIPYIKVKGDGINMVDENWVNKAQGFIKENEYHVKQKGNSNLFYAANTAQHLSFSILANGYSITPTRTSERESKFNNGYYHYPPIGKLNMEEYFFGDSEK